MPSEKIDKYAGQTVTIEREFTVDRSLSGTILSATADTFELEYEDRNRKFVRTFHWTNIRSLGWASEDEPDADDFKLTGRDVTVEFVRVKVQGIEAEVLKTLKHGLLVRYHYRSKWHTEVIPFVTMNSGFYKITEYLEKKKADAEESEDSAPAETEGVENA